MQVLDPMKAFKITLGKVHDIDKTTFKYKLPIVKDVKFDRAVVGGRC